MSAFMSAVRWLCPWDGSIVAGLATVLAAALFVRGAAGVAAPRWRVVSFWLGLVLVYVVTETQFEYFSEHEFFVHRLQHLVLHHIAPFLLVLARPGARLLAGRPLFVRSALASFVTTLGGVDSPSCRAYRALRGLFLNLPVASTLFVGIIAFWLIPSIHGIAMLDWRWYALMNWSVFLTGLLFWHVVLPCVPGTAPRNSVGRRILILLAVIPPQIAIGVLMFSAPTVLYPVYSLCGRAFAELSPMADQQLGALVLWIPGSMMSLVALLIIVQRVLALPPDVVPRESNASELSETI